MLVNRAVSQVTHLYYGGKKITFSFKACYSN
jgi:hypothetical protein